MNIYLAGPLFTAAERQWLQTLRDRIVAARAGRGAVVCLPQELCTVREIEGWAGRAKQEIFQRCRLHLDGADAVVAVLDGTQVDDGTAWEIGYFFSRRRPGQPIIGIRTDFRMAGDVPGARVNLMIDCSCDSIVTSVDGLLAEIARLVR